jgi:hypothetical protein
VIATQEFRIFMGRPSGSDGRFDCPVDGFRPH